MFALMRGAIKPRATLSGYAQAVLADSPIGFWRMGDLSGTVCTDRAQSPTNGTYNGGFTLNQTSLVTTDTSKAVSLNGSTGYALIGDRSFLNYSRNFTLEALIKPATVNVAHSIISHGVGGFYFRINASGKLEFLKSQTSSIAAAATTLVANTVYHVALTVDASGNWVIYLNGVSDGSGTTAVTFSATSAGVIVGMDYFSAYTAEPFSGVIDEVAIYNTALSSTRIAAHRAAQIA